MAALRASIFVAILYAPVQTAGTGDSAGLASQLAESAASLSQDPAQPKPDPNSKFLFYDILEHEQFNKQRKGMMYAYTVARALGRNLVLHRLRVRKYAKAGGSGQRGPPQYTHIFYPWRKFFNMSAMQGDVQVHEFDQLLHTLGTFNRNGKFDFEMDHVFYMNKLLEGDRSSPRMVDSACPTGSKFGTSPFEWSRDPKGHWSGQMFDFPGIRADSVRCVDIHGSLRTALAPFASARSIVLLNAHFQLGYMYREGARSVDRHYWAIREHLVFKQSLWSQARRCDWRFGSG